MNNKAIIAIVAVLIVVIAAAAVVLLNNDNGNNEKPSIDVAGDQGAVFGNANGDCRIDQDDIDLIEALINENDADTLQNFPLADANHDGVLNSDDVEIVRGIINGDATTVDVYDFRGEVVTVNYPIDNALVVGGTNMRVVISVLGMEDRIVANATTSYIGPYLDKTLYELRENGTITSLTTGATTEDLTTLSTLDVDIAIVEGAGTNSYTEDSAMSYFADNGIPALVFNTDNYNYVMSTISTIGILTGAEDEAEAYMAYMNKVSDTIENNLGDKAGTVTVMTVTMSNSVSGTESDYYAMSEMAGGENLADWTDSTRKYDPSSGDYWLLDPKYNPDYLFHFKSMIYGEDPKASDIEKYKSYFDQTNAYQNGGYYLINGTVPLPVRLAYMAETMYPDLFEEGWADSVFQEYIDNFTDLQDWDVKDHKVIWSVSDF